MEVPEIRMSLDSSPSTDEHHPHHHHHHHHQLTRFTGKGAEASGKRVVVGVDGSEHSNYACDWYFKHLWSSDDYVVLLNCPDLHDVVKNQWGGGKYVFDREVVDLKLKEEEEQLHHELEKFKEILVHHSAHGKVRAISAKSPGDAILKTAEEESCDLIVIGCRGRSALRRTILGTVSDYIVHHATVPLIDNESKYILYIGMNRVRVKGYVVRKYVEDWVVVCRHKTSRRKSSSIVPPNPEELQTGGK